MTGMPRRTRLLLPVLLALGIALAAGCRKPADRGRAPGDLAARQLRVVATTGMITDIVREIGGDRVSVTGLMGPGVDPHLYKASEGNVIVMAEADVIFYNGLHLEGKLTEVFEKMGGRISTVAVTDGIDRGILLRPPEFEGAYDPHVWFDVTLWMKAVEKVAEGLGGIDPAHGETYRKNAAAYLERLAALHRHVQARAGELPPERRVLITAHDAFNYFGRAYRFEVRGLQGVSTVTEAGTGDIRALALFIVERRIPAVFVETSISPRTIEALQEAVASRGYTVNIGGGLYSDALGDPGSPEGTYIGMVRHNIDTIVDALKR